MASTPDPQRNEARRRRHLATSQWEDAAVRTLSVDGKETTGKVERGTPTSVPFVGVPWSVWHGGGNVTLLVLCSRLVWGTSELLFRQIKTPKICFPSVHQLIIVPRFGEALDSRRWSAEEEARCPLVVVVRSPGSCDVGLTDGIEGHPSRAFCSPV